MIYVPKGERGRSCDERNRGTKLRCVRALDRNQTAGPPRWGAGPGPGVVSSRPPFVSLPGWSVLKVPATRVLLSPWTQLPEHRAWSRHMVSADAGSCTWASVVWALWL